MRALGIHVFAGGFTVGIQRSGFEVDTHLETHGFAADTARKWTGAEIINVPGEGFDVDWPAITDCEVCFGNPRCTGFSCITSGYDESSHGAWAKQTIDIHQLCRYGVANDFQFVVWESVQQAYSTGRDLLTFLRKELFEPNHYRIAHLMLNARSFGSCQNRKRYFFVAYKDCYRFNIEPPPFIRANNLYDAIWDLRDRPTHVMPDRDTYDFDSYVNLSPEEWHVIPNLPNGWCMNAFAKYAYWMLPEKYQITWDTRTSDMPFSLHCPARCQWRRPGPTMHSSSCRQIHPDHDRPLTVGELATIMGVPDIPTGRDPNAQMAKGIVPAVGEWLGKQIQYSMNNAWGNDDWESKYDKHKGLWVGQNTEGASEKMFRLTDYFYEDSDDLRYDASARVPRHRFNVEHGTGRLVVPWSKVVQSFRQHSGDCKLGRLADYIPEDELLGEPEASS